MNFDTYVNRVLGNEGGYVSAEQAAARNDPGGETNWGIAKRNHPTLDIKNLTRDAAIAIYKTEYWDVVKGDLLPPALAYQAFDFCVNSGPMAVMTCFARMLNVSVDWAQILAVAVRTNTTHSVFGLIAARLRHNASLRNFPSNGAGWTNRAANNIDFAFIDLGL